MKGFELILTLKDDCVFSERAATEGGHSGLDYIPGAALLGATAARLYRKLSATDAFTLFHSGQVRFGNGLPLTGSSEQTWPIPLCWHQAKGEKVEEDGSLIADQIWHLGKQVELPDNKQPQQFRRGYVTATGRWIKPAESLRLKTAIDPATGRARDAALFGYESLSAGQRFAARVTLDDGVPDELLQQLRDAFQEDILLGRSRSAEYGRTSVEVVELSDPVTQGGASGKEITLWLLSDLAALDAYGQPTLSPKPEWLGLPAGRLMVKRSFIRSRRYSPWNAHRGGPDLERQVLCQGSVLVFELERVLIDEEKARIAVGLGLHREAGLGQVWLDPDLLKGEHPKFTDANKTVANEPIDQLPMSELVQWLKDRSGDRSSEAESARRHAREYATLLISARKLKGLGEKKEVGPSVSQWGSVLALAKAPGQNFAQRLLDTNNGPCKPSAPGWQDEHWDKDQNRPRSFAQWLRDRVGETPSRRLIQHLAREVMDVIKKECRK
ncbi:MAG: hypothetical protein A2286_03425 [Gammaproteobacteria bacterium RIFOXYA12_FULL_61_12]|nr:MAG: hypothetical protein A2286_03425 [Gammaproteobacteria bacterium RIFOXYA12_FULL_61_12]OGT91288.1 MAG: hypothetical protein A2514_11000 [Gammaproteobacteria bacterium RIFOXYD12_FULL_61_37]